MILAIYLLAVVLLVSGFAGLISAINLVPTDLGFTYFQAGATSISAGVIVLALGLAVKVLDRNLKRLATPEAVRVQPADPVIDLPPLAVSPPAPEENLGKGLAIAGAAAVAGAVAATALASSEPPAHDVMIPAPDLPEAPLPLAMAPEEHLPEPQLTADEAPAPPVAGDALRLRTVEDLERDLFAQMDALPEPPPVSIPEPDSAPDAEPDLAPAARPDLFALPPLEPIPQASFAELDKAPESAADTLPQATSEPFDVAFANVSPVHDNISALEQKPVESPATIEAHAEAMPVEPVAPSPEPAPVVAAPAPAPGLIHDADFAAVADEMLPALAPISTLEIIGAYDSGGTRFTMYSDGSVVAAGPDSERRFRSLDELRQHIDSGQI